MNFLCSSPTPCRALGASSFYHALVVLLHTDSVCTMIGISSGWGSLAVSVVLQEQRQQTIDFVLSLAQRQQKGIAGVTQGKTCAKCKWVQEIKRDMFVLKCLLLFSCTDVITSGWWCEQHLLVGLVKQQSYWVIPALFSWISTYQPASYWIIVQDAFLLQLTLILCAVIQHQWVGHLMWVPLEFEILVFFSMFWMYMSFSIKWAV